MTYKKVKLILNENDPVIVRGFSFVVVRKKFLKNVKKVVDVFGILW